MFSHNIFNQQINLQVYQERNCQWTSSNLCITNPYLMKHENLVGFYFESFGGIPCVTKDGLCIDKTIGI